ncbi:MAG: hypothetical protein WCR53_03445 [Bacteroidaceae bacterium]|jgi:F-type H+-transporting ATPase subunit epsilon|nr:hypothetical protein [Bacteroidaceae bacterium]
MKLTIVSPEKILFKGDADILSVPGTTGRFEVLDHHAAIISSLKADKLIYKSHGQEVSVDVLGGFIEVADNVASVCVEV